ncbi:hypothetical protein ACHAWU_005892 [Discostella pseudostelligera]|uniref:Glutamine cyclotransferase n=1 Tax=Discostella pseudostelligera TaxID=259834 RepID=A0ABD3N1U6_9STRA
MALKTLATSVLLPILSQLLSSEALATVSNVAKSASASKILRSSRDYHLLEVVPHDPSSFTCVSIQLYYNAAFGVLVFLLTYIMNTQSHQYFCGHQHHSQGLTYFDGHIYEGTGMEHQSHLLRHDPTNQMKTLDKIPLTPSHLFGEGVSHYYVWRTDANGNPMKEHRLIQLTWKHKIGKIYSLPNMQLIQEFNFDTSTGEGWGITFIPHRNEFYVSDGSENLIVWDADTLVEKRRIVVTFEREPGTVDIVRYVNELEFVNFAANDPQTARDDSYSLCEESGICSDASSTSFTPTMKILANVWYQDVLVSIDPETGRIGRVFDLRDIYPIDQRNEDGADCLNGISVTNRASDENYEGLDVWVTGKLWPNMYRIRLID